MSIKLATAASVAALFVAAPALAADLNGVGGNCCADLEERVAELEATAARKGNRKVSLEVYGQVNVGVLHTEIDDLGINDTKITNNPNSVSRVGFKGNAAVGKDWSAGFLLEIGFGEAEPMFEMGSSSIGGNGVLGDGFVIRHSAIYLENKQLGTVWLGRTSTATDGIGEISIARVSNASTLLSLEPVSGTWLGGINLPFDGGRTEVVKWVSPTVGGFTASAAWSGNEDDAWDAALRYAGEFGAFKVAAGIGYRKEQNDFGGDVETYVGSASVMHSTSGLFANVAAAKADGWATSGTLISVPIVDFDLPFWFVDPQAVHVQAGIEKNFFGMGATTLYGEWGRVESGLCNHPNCEYEFDFWGLGVNQYIEAAAMDLYVGYREYQDLDARHLIGGALVRF